MKRLTAILFGAITFFSVSVASATGPEQGVVWPKVQYEQIIQSNF